MFATTKRIWELIDASSGKPVAYKLPAGRHELERVPCPLGHNCNWLVLKGTKIGMSENFWKDWKNGTIADVPGHPNFGKPIDWGEFEIIIDE